MWHIHKLEAPQNGTVAGTCQHQGKCCILASSFMIEPPAHGAGYGTWFPAVLRANDPKTLPTDLLNRSARCEKMATLKERSAQGFHVNGILVILYLLEFAE